MVTFDALKSSLLPFVDTKRPQKLILRLLQTLGAVVPGLVCDIFKFLYI